MVSREAKVSRPTPRDMNQSGRVAERETRLSLRSGHGWPWSSPRPASELTCRVVVAQQQGPDGEAEEDKVEKLIWKGRVGAGSHCSHHLFQQVCAVRQRDAMGMPSY